MMSGKVEKIGEGKTLRRFVRQVSDKTYILAPDARFLFCAVIAKAPQKESVIEILLDGPRARADIIFVYKGNGNDNLRLRVIIRHLAPHTFARVRGRSILFDTAQSDIRAVHRIEKKAIRADTYFSHHAMLLSPHSSARTLPSLEILTHDVKAGHAATAGPLGQDAILYLQTRGLCRGMAENLLIRGFIMADASHIPDARIRKRFDHTLHSIADL